MNDTSKDRDSDSREFYGLKVSGLLKALAERKPPPCDVSHIVPRSISTTLYTLKKQETETFRARAVLPENIKRLSNCRYKRHDYLKELSPASVLVPSAAEHLSHRPKFSFWSRKKQNRIRYGTVNNPLDYLWRRIY